MLCSSDLELFEILVVCQSDRASLTPGPRPRPCCQRNARPMMVTPASSICMRYRFPKSCMYAEMPGCAMPCHNVSVTGNRLNCSLPDNAPAHTRWPVRVKHQSLSCLCNASPLPRTTQPTCRAPHRRTMCASRCWILSMYPRPCLRATTLRRTGAPRSFPAQFTQLEVVR
jgi:hypothetical protein